MEGRGKTSSIQHCKGNKQQIKKQIKHTHTQNKKSKDPTKQFKNQYPLKNIFRVGKGEKRGDRERIKHVEKLIYPRKKKLGLLFYFLDDLLIYLIHENKYMTLKI